MAKIFNKKTIIILGIISVIRMWLTYGRLLTVGGSVYDDILFINLASSIISGNWLGVYNDLTLAKNPFYPIFLALNYFSGLPLLFTQDLIYLLSCLFLIIFLKKYVKSNTFLIILYTGLIFNPMSYTSSMNMVYREGIHPALTIFTLTSFASLYLNNGKKMVHNIFMAILCGISLSLFWLNREDGVFLLPSLFAFNIFYLFSYFKKRKKINIKILSIVFIPYLTLFLVNNIISGVNYLKYDNWLTTEYNDNYFKSAYGSLSRIKINHFDFYVPVSKDTREKAYELSPEFNKIKFAEDTIYPTWAAQNPYCKNNGGSNFSDQYDDRFCNEIIGGFYLWGLRRAAAEGGFYKNADSMHAFYKNIADEINNACDSNEIDCYNKRVSIQPIYNISLINKFLPTFFNLFKYTFGFNNFNIKYIPSYKNDSDISFLGIVTKKDVGSLFKTVTNNELVPASVDYTDDLNSSIKRKCLNYIGNAFHNYFKYFFIISLVLSFYNFIFLERHKKLNEHKIVFIISIIFLLAGLSRIALNTLVTVTSFDASSIRYLSPSYPMFIFFAFINIYIFLTELLERNKMKK